MSSSEDESQLPALQMDPGELEAPGQHYIDLIGFVLPRIQARSDLLAQLDPEFLTTQETLRVHAMYPAIVATWGICPESASIDGAGTYQGVGIR